MDPCPPLRAPHFFDDSDGPATLASARWLLSTLCGFARFSGLWRDRAGRNITVQVERETNQDALISLSGAISGALISALSPVLASLVASLVYGEKLARATR